MAKHYCLPFLFLFVSAHLFSQRYADKWYFGVNAALDFTGGSPVAVSTSQMSAGEGSATIADSASGALLFYTDGQTVWNKNDVVMPNGTGLMGGFSSTQAALIVPKPGSPARYYIFTTDQTGGSLGLRASMVDMSLDGGNGDVTTKNFLLKTPVAEKVTAVQQPGSSNIWVVAHGWGNDAFYAFKVTPTGVDSAVVSNTGIVHSTGVIQNSYGQMKFSPCGDRLALAVGYLDKVEIFDFNTTTGVVSNPRTISYSDHVYGIEFSTNGDVLYVSTYDPAATLVQYDLTITSLSAMIASAQVISATPDIYPLQRARDGKIYVCRSYSQYLGVIHSPDNIGTTCNYVDNGVDLDPSFMGINSGIGLPNFVQSYMGGTQFCGIATGVPDALDKENVNHIFPNPTGTDFLFSARQDNARIVVSDISGKQLDHYTHILRGGSFRFGQHYRPGVYLVTVTGTNGDSKVLKVMKTR